ncbi:sigma factor regulatory protein, FecR/PupR family [Bacteroides pyogenes F0041]|uniref:Sigma factor regulatory protein, FecR/PupR family n=1 Tax=Bacteroides pyogenes F0041 TaxID=1321819 RepID=U2E2M4_9BACE|nr:FecR domain-containing protein [Bacteroides pyogenes]ERI88387.1 sigma factor regulatory protein, FecR/PupR family [Bacteroides pyogenes F0041]MBB3896518.1 ferric-dicitrate binding protein FerR (iron transport regulator) [Bacteroides pyogenes]
MENNRMIIVSELIRKKVLGIITPEEREELECWLAESPRYRELLEKYERPEFLASFDPEKDRMEAEEAYMRWMNARQRKSGSRILFFRRWSVAAALVALMGVSLFFFYRITERREWQNRIYSERLSDEPMPESDETLADALLLTADGRRIPMSESKKVMTVSAGAIKQGDRLIAVEEKNSGSPEVVYNTLKILRGKRFKMQLSDGTKVWLNSESEITFPNRFEGSNRMVSVKGELLFEVTEDKSHPFIVNTGHGVVRVLGTAFNVHCYDNETPMITLVRGKIRYSLGNRSVDLEPGQQCRVNDDGLTVVNVDTYEYTAWVDEVITFKNKRLEELMNVLGRLYDVEIVYEAPSLKELPFTGAFRQYEQLDEILRMIEESGLIHIDREGRKLIIGK